MNKIIAIFKILTSKTYMVVSSKRNRNKETITTNVFGHGKGELIGYLIHGLIKTLIDEGYKDELIISLKESGVIDGE